MASNSLPGRSEPSATKSEIRFSSFLSREYREALEAMLFFNPQQGKALSGISRAIREYGVPDIVEDGDRLRIQLAHLRDPQTIFALDQGVSPPVLAGVMVFARIDFETLALLHIAVGQDYSRNGSLSEVQLVPRFMSQLRWIAKHLKGVSTVTLKYTLGTTFDV